MKASMISSAEEFYRLRSSDSQTEYERAAHDSAPIEVWLLVIDTYPEMRQWVAHNKTVPVEVLAILARDPDAEVRFFVAMKRKLPEYLQLELARDADYTVRNRIVWNAKATKSVLEELSKDREENIRRKAMERLASADYTS
jgi:hypothetical protein